MVLRAGVASVEKISSMLVLGENCSADTATKSISPLRKVVLSRSLPIASWHSESRAQLRPVKWIPVKVSKLGYSSKQIVGLQICAGGEMAVMRELANG